MAILEATPRFVYLIACYNEAAVIPGLLRRLEPLVERFPGSLVYLLDNGSTDDTWPVMQRYAAQYPGWVRPCRESRKGMGVAYRRGLTEIAHRALDPPLSAHDWVVLTAADLPFAFSDVDALLALPDSERRAMTLAVGSKAHPRSRAARDLKRRLGTAVLAALRRLMLGMKTRDSQGTLLIRADVAPQFLPLQADDFFVTIEIIDRAERGGLVREVPVTLEAEQRPSRVRLVADGWRMVRQLARYRRTRAWQPAVRGAGPGARPAP